jgi:hypothetical protein
VVHRRLLRQCPLLRVPADGCLGDVEDGRAAVGWGVGAAPLYWGNPPARAKHQMLRLPPLLTLLPLQVMVPKLLRRSFQTEGCQSERQTNQIRRLRMTFLLQEQNAWVDGTYTCLGLYCEILVIRFKRVMPSPSIFRMSCITKSCPSPMTMHT